MPSYIVIRNKVMKKYIFPLIFIVAACSENDGKTDKPTTEKVVKTFKDEKEMDEYVLELIALTDASGLVASSLNYQKSDGEGIEVHGLMDRDNKIHIVEEVYSEGNGKTHGTRYYYLNRNGKPFVTHELIDEIVGEQATFVDRVSYYDVSGKVVKTKERRAPYQDEIEQVSYKPVGLKAISIDRAWRALNSKQEFETTFQGFVQQDVMSYLIVGENKPDGYTSALRLDYKDQLIQVLYSNPDMYMGEPVEVNFQVHEDRGLTFQIYAGGKFVNEK